MVDTKIYGSQLLDMKTTFENGVKFTTAALGEFGKAKKVSYFNEIADIDIDIDIDIDSKKIPDVDRKNLKAWQIGAGVDYKGFAFAGAYGDIGKSGALDTSVDADVKRGGKYWSLGSAYSTEKYGISIKLYAKQKSWMLIYC